MLFPKQVESIFEPEEEQLQVKMSDQLPMPEYVHELPPVQQALDAWVREVKEKSPTHKFIIGGIFEAPNSNTQLRTCICSTNTATAFVKVFKESTNTFSGQTPATPEELKEIIELCLTTKNDQRLIIVLDNDGYTTYRVTI